MTNEIFQGKSHAGNPYAQTVTRTALMAILLGAGTAVADTYYVDPVNGHDEWSGTAETADPETVEQTKIGPKETLAGIVEVAKTSDDVIIALPGFYTNGVCETDNGRCRVNIPAGVTLKSRDGAEKTVIVGAAATNPDERGCGDDAIRCVQFGSSNSEVRGFTLTGGRTKTGSGTNARGGAINSRGSAYDCIITNNAAGRGGALGSCSSSAIHCYRCFFKGNDAGSGAVAYQGARFYNCLIDHNVAKVAAIYGAGENYVQIRNSTVQIVSRSQLLYDQGACYNSLIIGTPTLSGDSDKATATKFGAFTNCYFTVRPSSQYAQVDDATCVVVSSVDDLLVDSNWEPQKGSPLIDAGNSDFATSGVTSGGDYLNHQRIFNADVDVGCYEYDWRPDFSKVLMKSRLTVTNAMAEVSKKEDGTAMVIPRKSTIGAEWDCRSGSLTFDVTVTGSGNLEVYLDGVRKESISESESGTYKLTAEPGIHTLGFTGGTGTNFRAEIGNFSDPVGLILLFR